MSRLLRAREGNSESAAGIIIYGVFLLFRKSFVENLILIHLKNET